jgi:hypothetical protein
LKLCFRKSATSRHSFSAAIRGPFLRKPLRVLIPLDRHAAKARLAMTAVRCEGAARDDGGAVRRCGSR